MNYGKKGVRAKQKALNSKSQKWGRKLALTCVKIMLAAVVGIGICGVAAGIGVFRGILSSTPTIRLSDVVAVGEATIVYMIRKAMRSTNMSAQQYETERSRCKT